jgi:transposase
VFPFAPVVGREFVRGSDEKTGALFSYVDLEARVRADHPLRAVRQLANEALVALEADFSALYSGIGRPSIPPERLLRAMLLQAFYSIRSERQLMERDCQDFRVRAMTKGRKEPSHGTTQTTGYRRRAAGSAPGRR